MILLAGDVAYFGAVFVTFRTKVKGTESIPSERTTVISIYYPLIVKGGFIVIVG